MSGNRSCQSSCWLRKQTFSCSTKNKPLFPKSHADHLLQENHFAQQLNLPTQVFLSAILKYVTSNVLEVVGNKTHSNCRIQKAVDNDLQLSHLFEEDTNSQARETF
ncbi:histone H2A-like 3 [Camelus dromedarius]|uniref:Histone H2A-Bbd type 2/3 n=2 Tax=Camelus TaxID=9836 RepID=S9WJT2_CAMFR|nr:histone H2A-Bbd type 2/3-like [Camelus bactrianus]XP_010995375.1 histone H2A-Bbd type 2/3-like [Camelus dromedarius]XP_014419969.1 histone H2A-Bbd type 2/3 [Camelus ferus]EPY76488.1 histone H2A type 2-B-like protein [Camelus ferus]